MIQTSQADKINKVNKWNSVSFRINTPAGKAYIQIAEHSPGKIYKIFFRIGKAGSEINAMCEALAIMASDLLQEKSISDVIVHLSGITSDREAKSGEYSVKSTPAALMLALIQYKASIPSTETDYAPAKFR